MSRSPEIEIRSCWDDYGYLASVFTAHGPVRVERLTHHAGPRMAAEQAAILYFGAGKFTLRKASSRLHYVAVSRRVKRAWKRTGAKGAA